MRRLLAEIESAIVPAGTGARKADRRRAIAVLNQVVGAMVISRAVGGEDPEFTDDILAVAKTQASAAADSKNAGAPRHTDTP